MSNSFKSAPVPGETGRQSLGCLLKRTVRKDGPFVCYLVFILLFAYWVCCLAFWVDDVWWQEWDSAIYILAGRSLAIGDGYSYLGRPFFLRPPGLSWLISILLQDGPFDAYALNLMIMFFAAASITAVFFALKLKHGRWMAIGVALLVGTSPLYVNSFNWVASEFPFIALLFFGMALLQAAAAMSTTWRWWVASLSATICLAAAFYFRTVAILLIPGIILTGWLSGQKNQRTRAWIPALIMLGLCIPWLLHTQRAAASAETPSEQLLIFDYTTAIFHVDPGDPSSDWVPLDVLLLRVKMNGRMLLHELGRVTLGTDNPWVGWLLAATPLVGLVLVSRRRPSILEWFAIAYTVLLLTYFTYDSRLVTPLLPLLYLYLFAALSRLCLWVSNQLGVATVTSLLYVSVFALLMVANLARLPVCLHSREPSAKLWQQDVYGIAGWVLKHAPSDAVLLCHDAPIISLLTGRLAYTYQFQRSDDLLGKYAPDYLIFQGSSAHTAEIEHYMAKRWSHRWVLPSCLHDRKITVYELSKP